MKCQILFSNTYSVNHITTATDDIFSFFFFFLVVSRENDDISCESSA